MNIDDCAVLVRPGGFKRYGRFARSDSIYKLTEFRKLDGGHQESNIAAHDFHRWKTEDSLSGGIPTVDGAI